MRELCPNSSNDSKRNFAAEIANPATPEAWVHDACGTVNGPSSGAEGFPWYALSVKHQHERTVGMALAEKGFEAFSPTYRARRQWSDRTKEIELPLFAGYVFCRFAFEARGRVLDTPAISRVVQFGGTPAVVADVEIEAIRTIVFSKLPMRPWPQLKPGDRVRVERGPLRGVTGILLREKETLELIVSVVLLQRSVAVQLDASSIVPITGPC